MNKKINIKYFLDVLLVLVYKEWIVKYKGTYLGYFWSIAHPLILTVVYYIGFKVVMKVPIEKYTLFLIVALFPWQWFANTIGVGTWSFIANSVLLKKTLFPKFLLPLANNFVDMVHFMITLPIIMIVLYLYNMPIFHISWLYLFPFLLIMQSLINFSFAIISGTLNLFYRDIDRLVSLFLTLLIYISPVFYSIDLVPENLRKYFYINPMFPMINMWREMFYYGKVSINDLLILSMEIIFLLFLAIKIYRKFSIYFAERV